MKIVFWVSLGLVIYTYLGYPCLLFLLTGMHQLVQDLNFALRRRERRSRHPRELPSVSLVFSAYNEEAVVEEKMRNCAQIDYPTACLEIVVGCDGCTDRTAALARGAGLPHARIFDFPARRGKPVVLNDLVAQATGDILVFSDANTMLAPDAVNRLVRHFADRDMGCVSGELTFTPAADGARTEGFYWRYEVFLKFLESRLNMLVGANGGLFAIRRNLFSPIPSHGIIDDFLIAMAIRAHGYRVVYDPEANAVEQAAATVGQEFRRRVRIGAGNFHALRYTWRLLIPTAGLVALAYWSHKVLRWLVPFALVSTFCSTVVLAREPFYAFCAAAALGLCVLAAVGYRFDCSRIRNRKLFAIPYYFLSMNLALALGLVRCITGRQMLVWSRTARVKSAGVSR
jgi:cellulose synthase/poly-beta-1,6-N-acetylglucosamine synthase-like glycosyltransferase